MTATCWSSACARFRNWRSWIPKRSQSGFVTFPGYGISGHEWLSANGKYTFVALESTSVGQPGAIAVVANDSGEILNTWT